MQPRDFTLAELIGIALERDAWALAAHEKDLHGSAKEWELTAALARQLAAQIEKEQK